MKNKFESSEDFNTLALKLRMQRYDKETVEKLKLDAANFEREKNKKRKAIIKIQKFFRGLLSRKRFRSMIDDINTNIVIDYIRAKRKEKIRENPEIIISYYLNRYIQKKRDIKRLILFDYINFCSNFIRKIYVGFKIRKNIKPKLHSYRKCISKISNFLNSFKIRLILRSKKFQDYLVEISNIKSCLLTLMSDDRNSDKTEKLKREFMKRLPRLQRNFYEEFYKLKNNRKWVIYPKIDKKWFQSYLNILQTVNLQPINIFDENPIALKKSPQMKQKEIDSPNLVGISVEKNPVKKMPFEQLIEEKHHNNNENDEIIQEENFIENLNQNNYNNKYIEDDESNNNCEKNDVETNSQENNIEYNNNPPEDYDNRPIKVNPQKVYDFYKMMEETPKEGEIDGYKDESPKNAKMKVKKLRRKPPKYDARKAIEESKNNNQNATRNQTNNNFREFLKKIKEENSNEKSNENIELNNMKKDSEKEEIKIKSVKKENKNKKEIILKEHYNTEAGIMETIPLDEFTSTTLKNEEKTRRKKVVSNEINLRRKLHELEKSPPPRIDVKSIKSKIDCWTNDNEASNKKTKKTQLIIEPMQNQSNRYDFMERILRDYHSINLELSDYLNKKAENMKEFSDIPFIKMDSFYIKHYSNEIYEQLLMHLNKHYEELKN